MRDVPRRGKSTLTEYLSRSRSGRAPLDRAAVSGAGEKRIAKSGAVP